MTKRKGFFELSDNTKASMALFKKGLEESKDSWVKIGILDGGDKREHKAVDADGKPIEKPAGDPPRNVDLALWHEFGTEDGHLPERPFIRPVIDRGGKRYVAAIGKLMQRGKDVQTALGIIGAKIAADIKNYVTIGNNIEPPNNPDTIKAKGSSRPLVDTGQMIGGVTWLVGKGPDNKKDEGK